MSTPKHHHIYTTKGSLPFAVEVFQLLVVVPEVEVAEVEEDVKASAQLLTLT